jgi:hypothetical protein
VLQCGKGHKTPVIISYWDLKWRKKRLFKTTEMTETIDYGYPEDARNINIDAHDTYALNFTEQDYFSWGFESAKKGNYTWNSTLPDAPKL